MRPLEILLVLLVVPAVAWRLGGPRDHPAHRLLGGAAAGVALVQFLVEGYRWQLIAPYLVAMTLAVVAWLPRREIRRPRGRVAGWIVAGALGVGLPVLLPIPSLPSPGGPYAVGTTTIVAVDDTRIELYGPEPGGPRSLPIHIWYPAEPSDESAPGWLTGDVAAAVSGAYRLPGFFLDHLQLAATHAVRDAPFVSGDQQFPVIVYSHGWGGFGRISPDQPERLASHGYVVIAPDHTFGALVAEFPGGLVGIDQTALPDEEEVGEAEYQIAAAQLVATFAADIQFVFDLITNHQTLRMGDGVDIDRIGVYGHSTGGGAAVAACHFDERCDAVLGLDPWVIPVDPVVIGVGMSQPLLAIRSDGWVGEENDAVLYDLHDASDADSTILALRGANHYDFVALSQISPLGRYLGFTGSIPAPIAREAVGGTLVAFFDRHLKDVDTPLPGFEALQVSATR